MGNHFEYNVGEELQIVSKRIEQEPQTCTFLRFNLTDKGFIDF